jgi:hypothetical protein
MKYIYLDQNHWISLAKAVKGRPDGANFVKALDAAREAVANRRAVFLLSSVHFLETARAPTPKQRDELAALMNCLSMGVVLRPSRLLVEFQIRNAVRRMFGEPLLPNEPSPFGRGIEDAFGMELCKLLDMPPERAERLRSALDTPEGLITMLAQKYEAGRKAYIACSDQMDKEAVADYEQRRNLWAGEDQDFTHRGYAVILTKMLWTELQHSLQEIGRIVDDWGNTGPSRLMKFWESIPSLHVEMELNTQMHRQKSKPWTTHDDRDIGFLSLAIPACDVVVTEGFWVDLARRRKLDVQYKTVLLSDLRDLPKHLVDSQ